MPTLVQIQNAAAALVVVGAVSSVFYGLALAVDHSINLGQRWLSKRTRIAR